VGVAICKVLIDRIYRRLQHKKPWQEHCPEHRLPLVVISGFALSVLVALYGWAAEQRWPVGVLFIIVTLIGTAVFIGIVPLMAYIVDAFGRYSASALTAVLVTRCLMCTFLPLMVESLTKHLGFGFGFTILAILCLGLAPIPIIIMQYGASWRQNSEYTKDG
jgi:MFS family permease